jgi:autotransporter translocation and assembly factor TamB
VYLPEFEPLTVQGRLGNSLISPEFSLTMQSSSGNIAVDGSLDLTKKSYTLKMAWSGLELGKLAGISDLDRTSGNLELAGAAFKPDRMKIKASGSIDSAGYRRYNYHDIHFELDGDRGLYAFGVNSADTSFAINLTGAAEHNDSITKGKISGNFSVDAGRLNLFSGYAVRGELDAGMNQISGDMSAAVTLRNLVLRKENKTEDLESFALSFDSSDSLVTGIIKSDFIRADFHCNSSLNDLKKVFTEDSSRGFSLLDSTAGKIPYISTMPELNVFVELSYDPFIGLLMNDSVFGFHKVAVKLEKDSTGIARADISVDKFNFGMNSGFGTTMYLESFPDKSVLLVKADSLKYNKITLADVAIDMNMANNTALYRLKASDSNEQLLYDIAGAVIISQRQIKLRSTQSNWILNGFTWSVSPGDFLVLDPEKNNFKADLHWKNGQSSLDITGRKSEMIHLDCRNVWINMLIFPGMNTVGLDGELTGRIDYKRDNKNELEIQMDISQMKMADRLLGNMKINGSYQSDSLGTIESNLSAVMNDTSKLDLIVNFGKNSSQNSIRTDFSGIPLTNFESLIGKYISGLQGDVSGGLGLTSIGNKPQLNGRIQINKTALKVVPLNARFYLSDDVIQLENNQILFRQFVVLDSLKKRLNLNGNIDLNDPGNITADLQVTSDHLQVMNTTEKDNPAFNGSVFINSKLTITGPVQKPSIAGNIVLAGGTVVNYRYTENLTVSETEKTITFAGFTQDQPDAVAKLASVNPLSTSPNIKASIEIDPNSLFNFQISRGYDIGVKITGGGFLNYALMPNKAINLTGTYEIQQGSSELKIRVGHARISSLHRAVF